MFANKHALNKNVITKTMVVVNKYKKQGKNFKFQFQVLYFLKLIIK